MLHGPGGVFADEGFVVRFGAAEGGEIGGDASSPAGGDVTTDYPPPDKLDGR